MRVLSGLTNVCGLQWPH